MIEPVQVVIPGTLEGGYLHGSYWAATSFPALYGLGPHGAGSCDSFSSSPCSAGEYTDIEKVYAALIVSVMCSTTSSMRQFTGLKTLFDYFWSCMIYHFVSSQCADHHLLRIIFYASCCGDPKLGNSIFHVFAEQFDEGWIAVGRVAEIVCC